MKRIGAFSLAFFIFVLSVFSVIPVDVYADDNKTVLPFTFKQLNNSVGAGMSASDANAAVTAHKDIYTSDGMLLFIYNPSNSYNWTTSTEAYYLTLNYSDNQLKNILMSKNPLSTLFNVWGAALSNNNGIRAFCAGLGTIFSGNSDMGTKVLDTLSGNYNYLDSLNYDEDSKTITMSNDNGSVDKLREEIKKYYYDSIGCFYIKSSGKPFNAVNNFKNKYEYDDDLNSDLTASNNYDCAISFKQYSDFTINYFWDDSDFDYLFFDNCGNGTSYYPKVLAYSNDGLTKHNPCMSMKSFYGTYINKTDDSFRSNKYIGMYNGSNIVPLFNKDNIAETNFLASKFDCGGYFTSYTLIYYSKTGKPFTPFKSYSSYYNFINGDQNAYLFSTIEKTGEDITFSIKDMNENLGNKMDALIDSINSKKESLSADELQKLIDSGLEDIKNNTEDIKDNTSDILDTLKEQNNILLQILGVTEYIAYQTTKDDGSSYTKTDLTNTINKIYNGLGNAILYGKNTLTDSGDSSGAASQSSIVTREDFKLSNNIYTSSGSDVSPGTPVVAYSLDDCSVYDDSNDYDVGIATQDINNMDIHDGLFGKFPFSVPYQLYEWLQVLQADPVAPKLVYNYGFLLGHKDDQKYDLVIDFSIYESWANVCKSFLRLAFTLAMSLFLYKKFKGNSIF